MHPNSTITLTFTMDQMAVLNEALLDLPFRKAAPLIQHINSEIQRAAQADQQMRGAISEPSE